MGYVKIGCLLSDCRSNLFFEFSLRIIIWVVIFFWLHNVESMFYGEIYSGLLFNEVKIEINIVLFFLLLISH